MNRERALKVLLVFLGVLFRLLPIRWWLCGNPTRRTLCR